MENVLLRAYFVNIRLLLASAASFLLLCALLILRIFNHLSSIFQQHFYHLLMAIALSLLQSCSFTLISLVRVGSHLAEQLYYIMVAIFSSIEDRTLLSMVFGLNISA